MISMITFVWPSERYAQHNKRYSSSLFQPASAALNIQGTLPASAPHLPTQRRVLHSCSAGLPTQRLIKLQLRNRLRIRTHGGRPLSIPCFRAVGSRASLANALIFNPGRKGNRRGGRQPDPRAGETVRELLRPPPARVGRAAKEILRARVSEQDAGDFSRRRRVPRRPIPEERAAAV